MQPRIWHASYPCGMPHTIDVDPHQTLTSALERSFGAFGERAAFSCLGETLTYTQLYDLSSAVARYLNGAGLKQGDRVALLMPNGLAYPIALVAALRLGLAVVTVNPLYTLREIEHQLADAGPACIVLLDSLIPKLESVLEKLKIPHIVSVPVGGIAHLGDDGGDRRSPDVRASVAGVTKLRDVLTARNPATLPPPTLRPESVAFLQYTGGTTGLSKGAMLTHGSVGASLAQTKSWLRLALDEHRLVTVVPLPMYHILPLAMTLLTLQVGGHCRLVANPRDTDALVHELARSPFHFLIGVNTLFNSLVNHPLLPSVDFSETKVIMGAGAAVQEAVANRWANAGGPPITEAYGLTEASPGVTFNPIGRSGTIGLPTPSTDVRIVDADDREVANGLHGELLIKGPQVFAGYWGQEGNSAGAFTLDGWLRTGDIVTMDTDGFLYLADRKKDMISVSGFNVYPNEIEGVVATLSGVAECACVGIDDPKAGEAPHLFVVVKDPELTLADIENHCRENLAAYKVPRRISFVSELPKSAVGKILRRLLRDNALPQ